MTDDDNDIGPIVVAVVLGTLVVGAFLYGWNRYELRANSFEYSHHRAHGPQHRAEPTSILIEDPCTPPRSGGAFS